MSVGMILLTATAILVFFGAAQRVLDKLHLTDRMALLLIALMFFGTLLPNLTLGSLSISVGGALIPSGICIYLFFKADTNLERWRTVLGVMLTAGLIYAFSTLMPDEPEAIVIDPLYLCGLVGGLVAYLLGRSRRGAFVCGVLGVLLADFAVGIINRLGGIKQQIVLGGAGVFDTAVISGLLGVILAEFTGEILERFVRGSNPPTEKAVQNPPFRKEK